MLFLKNMPAHEFLDKFFKLDNLKFDTIYDDKLYNYNVVSYNDKEKDGNIVALSLTLLEKKDENVNWSDIQYKYLFLEFYLDNDLIKFSDDTSDNKTKQIVKDFVDAVINA